MQKFKSKLLPFRSFSRLPSVMWKKEKKPQNVTHVSDCDLWFEELPARVFSLLSDGSEALEMSGRGWRTEISGRRLQCSVWGGWSRPGVLTASSFSVWNVTRPDTEFTHPFVPWCWWIMREAILFLEICSQKISCPWLYWRKKFSGGKWATLYLGSVRFHRFPVIRKLLFFHWALA